MREMLLGPRDRNGAPAAHRALLLPWASGRMHEHHKGRRSVLPGSKEGLAPGTPWASCCPPEGQIWATFPALRAGARRGGLLGPQCLPRHWLSGHPRPSAVGLLTPLPSSAIFSPGGGGKEMSGMMDRKGQVGSAEEGPQGWRGRGTERRGGGRTEQSRDKDPRRQKIRLRVGNPETKMRGPGRWRERDRERWGGDGAWGQSLFPSRQRETETGKDGERDTQETDKWTDRHTQDRGLCGERNQGGRGGGGRGKGREEGRRAKRGREEQR